MSEEQSHSAGLPEPPEGACLTPLNPPTSLSSAPCSVAFEISGEVANQLRFQLWIWDLKWQEDGDANSEAQVTSSEVISTEIPADVENGNNNSTQSRADLSTPSKSITCQPQARSTPLHPATTTASEQAGLLKNGTKSHTHLNNGLRNGGTLPRAASSSSSSSSSHKNPKKLQSNPSINSQSSKRSKGSSKSNSSQIPTEAQDDCCVHCILACLFCEFLTLCNIVLDCATCGSCASDDSCFCCCCASEECGDCDLPCDLDCGIIDACCESADCLEICMECCGLCFSS
ncbi:myoD family inhibitor [Chanos chanos]|uniref:MyoD family inhibitor n=1 Tax=Chanos chanos TaxID=29144 RepID=A0A6J2VMK5_CHACN|nr:myoD family inhibitor [Chanos chanos]